MTGVRTRFAPSPTGTLHVGNARTAVVNWLVARHHGGHFVLRIEDTDPARNVPGAEQQLMEDLQWLGLEWDEGPQPNGEERGGRGPYHQSQRLSLYHHYAARLLESDSAYRCFCDASHLKAERRRALDAGRSPIYAGTCRGLDPRNAQRRAEAGEPHVLRLATPDHGQVEVHDRIRGAVSFDSATLGDFVLLRSDGLPTYNFAVVVDDAEMEISHVIRDAGHLSNSPFQILVYQALGLEPPAFAHTPTVLAPDRSKLSKRAGAQSLDELREQGFHPHAVLNYLSLLGWSSPSGDEILTPERLIQEVTLERMNAADVVFDPDKMRWVSSKHIDAMPLDDLERAVRPFIEDALEPASLGPRFSTALEAIRGQLATFNEVSTRLAPFLGLDPDTPIVVDPRSPVLGAVRTELASLETWDAAGIQRALKAAGATANVRGKDLYIPVRKVLTGDDHGPPLAVILEVQGRDRVLARLDAVLATPGNGLTPGAEGP